MSCSGDIVPEKKHMDFARKIITLRPSGMSLSISRAGNTCSVSIFGFRLRIVQGENVRR